MICLWEDIFENYLERPKCKNKIESDQRICHKCGYTIGEITQNNISTKKKIFPIVRIQYLYLILDTKQKQ